MVEEAKPIKTERIDNPDGTYTVKSIFDKNEDYLSKIENFTKDNDLIQATWYKDNDFSDVICIQINNLDENTTIISRYYDEKNNYKSEKKFYNKYNAIDKIEYYYDYELKSLYAIEVYKYYPFHIEAQTIFEHEHNGYFSCIEYYKLNGRIYKAIAFYDKCYKKVYRKTKSKYLKNDVVVVLRVYSDKKENKYLSEIEKFDSDGNSIQEKQYKFKGILAHILFWLAR